MAKKSKDNPIYSYYQQIENGSIAVGDYIEKIYQYLIRGINEKLFFFDQKKANDAIEWIETHTFHTEGDLATKPFLLELWEKALIAAIFGIVDEKGTRQFREVVLIVARKNGKSLLAAAIARYIWMMDGGFGTKIYTIAPKLDQANIIYNNIWQMTLLDPEYKALKEKLSEKDQHNKKVHDDSELPKHRMSDLYITANNSMVQKIAFSAKKSDGFNPSMCICDEVASWEGESGLRQYEVMKSGMGARSQALLLSCTTSGYVNDSIYDELLKRCTRFIKGDSSEKRLLPFLYMIDDPTKWNDINELRKSNPNLGVSVSVDFMLEEIAIAEGSLSKKAEFITKYCNLKQNSSLAWLDVETVRKCFGDAIDINDFRSSYAIGGIDLSQTTDLTAAVILVEKDGEIYVFSKAWLPAEKIDEAIARDNLPYKQYIENGWLSLSGENFIDYHDCFDWFRLLVEEYEILPVMVGYDRYSAQYLIQDMEGYGFRTDDVYQGDNLWGVLQEMEGLFKDGKVHCGDNDLMKVHMLNSAIKMSTERGRGRLVKIRPSMHIDLVAALADAFCVRQKHYAELQDRIENKG